MTKIFTTKSKSAGFGSELRKKWQSVPYNQSLLDINIHAFSQLLSNFIQNVFFSETASFRMSFPNKFYNMEVTQSVYVVTLSCKCKFAARYDNTLLKIIIF